MNHYVYILYIYNIKYENKQKPMESVTAVSDDKAVKILL